MDKQAIIHLWYLWYLWLSPRFSSEAAHFSVKPALFLMKPGHSPVKLGNFSMKPAHPPMKPRRGDTGLGQGRCDRCHTPTTVTSMSWFNTEMCCEACLELERQHPDYPRAAEAEEQAVRAGDLNFPGIGKPSDL